MQPTVRLINIYIDTINEEPKSPVCPKLDNNHLANSTAVVLESTSKSMPISFRADFELAAGTK